MEDEHESRLRFPREPVSEHMALGDRAGFARSVTQLGQKHRNFPRNLLKSHDA